MNLLDRNQNARDQFANEQNPGTEPMPAELQETQQQSDRELMIDVHFVMDKMLSELSNEEHAVIKTKNVQATTENQTEIEQERCHDKFGLENVQTSASESSDDNIPLIQLQKKIIREGKRKQNQVAISNMSDDDNDENSDVDANYVPSFDSSSSTDEYQTPVIEKRRRKWVRKRIRPLKRERNRKEQKRTKKIRSDSDATTHEDQDIQKALQNSKKDSQLNTLLRQFAEKRIDNLLTSNGLKRKQIEPDGNCFFNSIIHQVNTETSVTELRTRLCRHLREHEQHYIGYMTRTQTKDGKSIPKNYHKLVEELGKDGIWDTDMSDVLPLATANVLGKHITIYTSRLHCPIINVSPDIGEHSEVNDDIKIAYLAVSGFEHYDSCIRCRNEKDGKCSQPISEKDGQSKTQPHNGAKTPTKKTHVSDKSATPRKKADYVSPIKITHSRKKTPNVQRWKKNIRKAKRNTGKSYISDSTNKVVASKNVLQATCNNCKNKCLQKVSEDVRKQINNSYYEETMTYERKRDFICQHIDVTACSNRYGRKRKQQSRKFYLTVDSKRVQVCKSFFLKTLNIGKKVIECALKRKFHGSFDGTDQRGKHPPANKTNDAAIQYIKHHIESFPRVESHYTRKTTSRQFLSQGLSIRKMYELYKAKCQEDNKASVSEKVYRNVFCNDFNLSFHKPKKDMCQVCNTFNEKNKTGHVSDIDQLNYNEHIRRKEESRIEKENDKKKAKSDTSTYVATFDLQAVLQTPCSNVSQTYYKRKLNSFNLTVYSLADSKGTCYVWNETHGQRGSSEIGTCIMTHLNSLPANVQHVILYSDCCSGQNRNQYLAAGLLNIISRNPNIQVIEQKFLESGHTQMECDSMHAAIEHAKKQTSLYIPEQWDTIFQMARRNNPYSVVPLRYDNFYDLKKYAKDNFKNFKTTSEGTKVNWLKVKVLKVEKSHPDQIQIKYNFGNNDFLCINAKRAQRGRPETADKIPMKYKEKLPISVAKKNDLLSLCKGYVIPEVYWPYYESLPTNKKVVDRLSCADALDCEDSDTDEEF